jgi:hypothetical protein
MNDFRKLYRDKIDVFWISRESITEKTGLLEAALFLEQEFAIILEDYEIIEKNLGSFENMALFLEKRLHSEKK